MSARRWITREEIAECWEVVADHRWAKGDRSGCLSAIFNARDIRDTESLERLVSRRFLENQILSAPSVPSRELIMTFGDDGGTSHEPEN